MGSGGTTPRNESSKCLDPEGARTLNQYKYVLHWLATCGGSTMQFQKGSEVSIMKMVFLLGLLCAAPILTSASETDKRTANLSKDLLLYASFNNGLKADQAAGDGQLYWAPAIAFPPV